MLSSICWSWKTNQLILKVLLFFCLQLESLPAMVARLRSNDNNLQLGATTQIRKLLSIGIDKSDCCLFLHLFPFSYWIKKFKKILSV